MRMAPRAAAGRRSTGRGCRTIWTSRCCWPAGSSRTTCSTRSRPRCPGAWTCPAASNRSRGSRTASACAISWRKYGGPIATWRTPEAPSRRPFGLHWPAQCRIPAQARDPMSSPQVTDFHAWPDADGHFGRHGGRFVAETLVEPLRELAAAYDEARADPAFLAAFEADLAHYVGRPSPIYYAQRLSREVGGARILLKREDLNHTGAHKINNTIGQA